METFCFQACQLIGEKGVKKMSNFKNLAKSLPQNSKGEHYSLCVREGVPASQPQHCWFKISSTKTESQLRDVYNRIKNLLPIGTEFMADKMRPQIECDRDTMETYLVHIATTIRL